MERKVGGGAGAVAAPVSLRQQRVVPFSWQTGVTRPRQRMPGQSIFKPWSDARSDCRGRIGGDRCLGILTQAVAQGAASCKEPSGRPVSGFHFRMLKRYRSVHRCRRQTVHVCTDRPSPVSPKDSLISRLTLECASRQIAHRMNARSPFSANNVQITPFWHDIRKSQNHLLGV